MKQEIPVIAVVGPTASGKTKLAVELAKHFNGEIISADSMQIYKYMDIATAKVTVDEMQNIPHHLIDIIEPCEPYNVVSFVENALVICSEINQRKKIPIIAGGTGLYITSLIDGINFSVENPNTDIRKELYQIAQQQGKEVLYNKLLELDPQSAENIHPNNVVRVVRAIEMFYTTGKSKAENIQQSKSIPSIILPVIIGISFREREKLYDRINLRIDLMVQNGLIEETKKIMDMGYGLTASNAIGYKEIIPYINGSCELQPCVEQLKQTTRRYAKRQLTWFNRDKRTKWFFVDDYLNFDDMLSDVIKTVNLEME